MSFRGGGAVRGLVWGRSSKRTPGRVCRFGIECLAPLGVGWVGVTHCRRKEVGVHEAWPTEFGRVERGLARARRPRGTELACPTGGRHVRAASLRSPPVQTTLPRSGHGPLRGAAYGGGPRREEDTMAPRPAYGRIRIQGRTWRWTAMGSARPESGEPECHWVVCFRATDDPLRSVRVELSPRDGAELNEGRLRRLFSAGYDPTQASLEKGGSPTASPRSASGARVGRPGNPGWSKRREAGV